MSKSLEALERLRNTLLAEGYWQDILQDVSIIEKELKALNEMIALHDKWLGNEMSDFEFFTLLSETRYKYGLSKI